MIQGTRSKLKQQKLRITFFGYLLVLIFFGILQIISVLFFTQGFLLSREVPDFISDCQNQVCEAPRFDKAIILVIDALRFDFTIPVDGSDKFYHNNLPILHQLHQNQPETSVLLKFIADPPTTTLQRLKGLTTGSLPTFLDAGSNFNGDAIDEDNWLLQLFNHNKTVAFMGDDTWEALFKKYIHPDLNFPYPSLNVWDFHTVDNGVLENLYPLLESQDKWDVLIGHFLGVDHIGHRYGPNHHTMKEKLNQMNHHIEQVIEKMDDSTVLMVMGDHGMDPTGNHGGDSKDELEASLFIHTKKKGFHMNKKPFLDSNGYDISEMGQHYRSVNQIDLVPTISILLGLPIPHNNLGIPIDEVFETDSKLSQMVHKTIKQINTFRGNSGNEKLATNQELNEQFEFVDDQYSKFTNKKYATHLITLAKEFQLNNLNYCKHLWAKFDFKFILLGITLLFFSFTFILTYSRSIPSVRVSTMSFEFLGSIIAMCLLGLVVSLSIYIVLMPQNLSLKNCLAGGAGVGMIIGFWAPIMDRFSVGWLVHQIYDFFIYNFNSWSFMGLVFLVLHCLIFASNSYVIWEDKLVSFFLMTFGVAGFFSVSTNFKLVQKDRILGLVHCFTFVLTTRLVSTINLCREEQGGYCKPTFFVSWWSVLLLHLFAFFLPLMIKSFYKLTNSYHSAAPLWINTGLKFLMILNAFYWTFEYIDDNNLLNSKNSKLNHFLTDNLLKSFKLAISRIVLFVGLILANYSWSRGPLCVKIEFSTPPQEPSPITSPESSPSPISSPVPGNQPEKPTATILGYENIYGSSYFLLVINFAVVIMLTSKPLAAISIAGFLIQVLSFLELLDVLEIRRNLISPIIIGLLGYQHFFSTGHQATIPSIQWDAAFMLTDNIVFPFTHITLVLNNFGPFILACLVVPLIILWKIPPTTKPIAVLSHITTVITSLLTYQTLLSLSSFIFTAHFRRHLMVWKIFAPRFMLNGVLLILVNVVLIFLTLLFGAGKILTQVNRIFGR